MGTHIHRQPLVRPAGQRRDEDELTRGADGQELAKSLHQGQQDDRYQEQSALPSRRFAYSILAFREQTGVEFN